MSLPKNQIRNPNSIRQAEHEDAADARRVLPVDVNGEPISLGNPLPVTGVTIEATYPDTSVIFNELVAVANSEVSVLIPAKTKMFTISTRTNKAIVLKYSFVASESATKYVTVKPGTIKEIRDISFDVDTPIYFQLSNVDLGGTVVEIEAWK